MEDNMKKIIITGMSIIFIFGLIGCVTYSHTQAVRNETGSTVTEVYIRDTGTAEWGSAKNIQIKTDSERIVLFRDSSSSEPPTGIRNKDIIIKDSNGLLYMKYDVPITFTTTKITEYMVVNGGSSEVLTTSAPIIFTVQDRLPILFVVNQTGYAVTLITPIQNSINDKGRIQFQPMEMNRSIDVTYRISQATYTEQVTMGNKDATVTLTKKPPTLTIVNSVGSTINMIFIRIPGSPTWEGGNIVIRGGTVHIGASGGAQAGDISGSIVNRDNMKLWLGNVPLTGNTFDIRIDDVDRNSYVKSNVQITNDMTLTFTQADKR
jgi:hypothetical protein